MPNEETQQVIRDSRKGINVTRHKNLNDYFEKIEKTKQAKKEGCVRKSKKKLEIPTFLCGGKLRDFKREEVINRPYDYCSDGDRKLPRK